MMGHSKQNDQDKNIQKIYSFDPNDEEMQTKHRKVKI